MVLQASLASQVTLVSQVWLLSRLLQESQVNLVLHVSWQSLVGSVAWALPALWVL